MAAHVDDTLWDEFHSLVNMTSRELRDWLATDDGTEPTAGQAAWRRRLMRMGHDPLKPVGR